MNDWILVEVVHGSHDALSSCLEVTRMWRIAGELGKKALNEIEPGAVFWCEGEFKAAGGLIGEPSSGLLGDVGRMIVEDQLTNQSLI